MAVGSPRSSTRSSTVHVRRVYAATAGKPGGFLGTCKALENKIAYPDSARLTIPRALVGLYYVRSRRNVRHVSANHMDAELVLATAKLIVAELIPMFHSTDVRTAADVVDALGDLTLPVIWEVDGVRRVLDTSMSLSDQTLLLYSEIGRSARGPREAGGAG